MQQLFEASLEAGKRRRLGGQVKLNQNWGLNGELKMNRDGDKEYTVGPRFSW